MPRRKTHKAVGIVAGVVTAVARSRPEDGAANLLVVAGGGIGGWLTSMWPDWFEPATTFNHRRFFHSYTVGGAVPVCTAQVVQQWESHWRAVAVDAHLQSIDPRRTPAERAFLLAVTVLAWILVGLLAGLAAGYVSHLLLDLRDPSGLPLLGLSF